MQDAPKQLYVEGNCDLLLQDSIAIVGTRNLTDYGKKYASIFAKRIAKEGITIVSGMAVGIDTVAHIYSMKEKGRTIAVLGGGFNNIFPKENIYLYKQIIENGGCIVSEYSPDTPAYKQNFPKRNRIISGLAMGVLLVEARYRSGSTITARYAIKQGKQVFCIPNKLDEPTGYSGNYFIKNGANLVTCPKDILDFYNICDDDSIKTAKEYEEIYELIGMLPISADELSKLTHKPLAEIEEALCMLELEGLIKHVAGNRFIKVEVKSNV